MFINRFEYHGYEDFFDFEKDMQCDEVLDGRLYPAAKGIEPEFEGTVVVTIEYFPKEKNVDVNGPEDV